MNSVKMTQLDKKEDNKGLGVSYLSISRLSAIIVMAVITLIAFILALVTDFWVRSIPAMALLAFHGFLIVTLVELPSFFAKDCAKDRTSILVIIMPLLFQVSLLFPLLLASLDLGLGLSDLYLWLWLIWAGSLSAAVLFYALNRLRGSVAKHEEKSATELSTKSISRANFNLASLLVIVIVVFYANFWGFAAVASFPSPASFLDSEGVVSGHHASSGQVNSAENDYSALEIIAGTYREIEYFYARPDGTIQPVTRNFDTIYTFSQDKTFEILQEDLLLSAGDFTITKTQFDDDLSQISHLSLQALESLINYSEFDLYRIDTYPREGAFANIQSMFFMFRTNDGRVIIHDALHGDVSIVERLE